MNQHGYHQMYQAEWNLALLHRDHNYLIQEKAMHAASADVHSSPGLFACNKNKTRAGSEPGCICTTSAPSCKTALKRV